MPDWFLYTAALGGSGVAALTSGLWVWEAWRHGQTRASAQLGESGRQAVQLQLEELSSDHANVREALSERERAISELEAERARMVAALRKSASELASSEDFAKERSAEIDALRSRFDELKKRASAISNKAGQLRSEVASAEVRERNTRQLLRAVGLRRGEEHHDPAALERRPISREVIRRLMVETPAQSAALVRSEGLVGLAVGDDDAAQRLAVFAAWISDLRGELGQLLCAPLRSLSILERRSCQHLLALPGSPWWVGVENLGDAPLYAMQRAHLDLVELPAPPEALEDGPDVVLDLEDVPDEALSAQVTAWSRRWGMDAVTVLDEEGRPLAANAAAQPSTAMAVRRALTPYLRRLQRDGRVLEDATLVARGEGVVSAMRLAGPDLEAPFVVVVGGSEPPERALEELCGVLRWRRTHSPAPRAAK